MSNLIVGVTGYEFEFILDLKEKYPQYRETLDNIEADLNQKLWHQLSGHILQLTDIPELQNSGVLIDVYNKIVFNLETAFNPMKLIMIIANVIKNYNSKEIGWLTILENYQDANVFLEHAELKINPKGEEMLFLMTLKVRRIFLIS